MDNSVHFGLGKVTKIDSVLIEWNSREKEVLYNIDTNQNIIVKQSNSKINEIKKEKSNFIF